MHSITEVTVLDMVHDQFTLALVVIEPIVMVICTMTKDRDILIIYGIVIVSIMTFTVTIVMVMVMVMAMAGGIDAIQSSIETADANV